jgi:hypothetical protein
MFGRSLESAMHWTPTSITVLGLILVLAYAWETLKWRHKPVAELEQMVTGRDWQKWKAGLKELKRRGDNIERFIPLLLNRMIEEKRMRREAARITLSDMFPHLRSELKGYSSADDPAVAREKLAPLLARYPAPAAEQPGISVTGFIV